jgi:hypothetical protein
MDSPFPFGFPPATAFYLVLYVATFVIHQAFMHYVVAGCMYVAGCTIAPGRDAVPRANQLLAGLVRDWMPFALSAAITAGVAPLLFVQVVYPKHFYTANLLLSWRWMILIPVLVAAFYLLYLVKSAAIDRWPYLARVGVVLVVTASFVFIGFCWTANHLLSADESNWPGVYATGQLRLSVEMVLLRSIVWIGGACCSLAVVAGWQLKGRIGSDGERTSVELRRLAWFALGGLGMAFAAGGIILIRSREQAGDWMLGPIAIPYVVAAAAGAVTQGIGWIVQLRIGFRRWQLPLATLGWLVALLGVAVVRESIRLASLGDLGELYVRHRDAREIGGWELFLVFAVLNGGVICFCIWLVRRNGKAEKPG